MNVKIAKLICQEEDNVVFCKFYLIKSFQNITNIYSSLPTEIGGDKSVVRNIWIPWLSGQTEEGKRGQRMIKGPGEMPMSGELEE